MDKRLKRQYEQNSYDLAEMLIRKAFSPKELEKGWLLPEWLDRPFMVMMRDEKSKETYGVDRYCCFASRDKRCAYRVCCAKDSEDGGPIPKDVAWKVVHPLTLKSYPIGTFPADEFPSEKEYGFIRECEYRKGNKLMVKIEEPLAHDPSSDWGDDELCFPESKEYGIDELVFAEYEADETALKNEDKKIQGLDKESIPKIAEAIVTKQCFMEGSFYEVQSLIAAKYLLMSCMSYLLVFTEEKCRTWESVRMLIEADKQDEYWEDEPLGTPYWYILDEAKKAAEYDGVPEPDCLRYYRMAMLGMKHNEVVGNALRAINEYIGE